MKKHITLLLFVTLPALLFSQGVSQPTFDKFLKKNRITTEPAILKGLAEKEALSLDLVAEGSSLYLYLSGAGWGASTVDRDEKLVFLFSNDSSVTLRSTSLQSFEAGPSQNIYRHQYHISPGNLEALSRYNLVALRKFSFGSVNELAISADNREPIKRLSTAFLQEVKQAGLTTIVREVQAKEIGRFVGDSVQFCTKVYRTRYFKESENGPTLLDIQADFSDPFVSVIILQKDRAEFNQAPEVKFLNKNVCISGVVTMRNNVPYVAIYNRRQIRVMEPVSAAEAGLFEGDSVTVAGKVEAVQLTPNNGLLLQLSDGSGSHPLLFDVVITQHRQMNLQAADAFYRQQRILVSGKVGGMNGRSRLVLATEAEVKRDSLSALPISQPADGLTAAAGGTTGDNGAETLAEFPGGQKAFQAYLESGLLAIPGYRTSKIQRLVAAFEIDEQGNCRGVRMAGSAGVAIDNEIKKLLLAMPKWKPAFRRGRFVATRITQPLPLRSN